MDMEISTTPAQAGIMQRMGQRFDVVVIVHGARGTSVSFPASAQPQFVQALNTMRGQTANVLKRKLLNASIA